jgi:hypothetical protein
MRDGRKKKTKGIDARSRNSKINEKKEDVPHET